MSMSDTIFNLFTNKNRDRIKAVVGKTSKIADKYASITHSQEKIKVRNKTTNEVKVMTREEYEFYEKTKEFRRRLRNGETIEEIMPEAFALCREATRRRLGMFHYDVQIEAAAAMQNNCIAEMKTGEGKSLVQILSAYLNALEATKSLNPNEHKSVHIITANEYLAERDHQENSKVFALLGLTSGYAMSQGKTKGDPNLLDKKREAYSCDIVFATAPTIAFDYLEDNHALSDSKRLIRKQPHKAIVDEADDILLDQATKPLILSKSTGTESKIENIYDWAVRFINGEPGYRKKPVTCKIFDQYDKNKYDPYTEDCALYLDTRFIDMEYLAKELYGDNPDLTNPEIADDLNMREQAIIKCLLAREYFKEGKQYQVFVDVPATSKEKDTTVMKIMLTDTFTGRSLESTKYQDGFQEAIEATVSYNLEQRSKKENKKYRLNFSKRNRPIAKCTYPDFLSIYKGGVCGMTGTSDEEEFESIYGVQTYEVPSRKPNIRIDEQDELYVTEEAKFKAIIRDILECQKTMQPILIGTTSVEESNRLCKKLEEYGIRFQRLDAVNKDNENGIKETAGLLGSITVATNMAGRGIDIKLGPGAAEAGGLYVIGTSKNKNKRIDNQLRGRAGRQGDPGRTKYFMSLDDELVRIRCGTKKIDGLKQIYQDSEERITNKTVLSIVRHCQETEESKTKQVRRQTEEKEAKVFTQHKRIIYDQRMKILKASDDEIIEIIDNMITDYVESLFDRKLDEPEIEAKLGHLIDVEECFSEDKKIYRENITNKLKERFLQKYSKAIDREKYITATRRKMLKTVDEYWLSHMEQLDRNWTNAVYYSYSQVNPMEIYERQSAEDLQTMTYFIQNEMITYALDPSIVFGQYVIKKAKETKEKGKILI